MGSGYGMMKPNLLILIIGDINIIIMEIRIIM